MRHHGLRPDCDPRRRQPFRRTRISPGGINREILQQQIDVAAIHRKQAVADGKGIILGGQDRAVDRIDQQDAIVDVGGEAESRAMKSDGKEK